MQINVLPNETKAATGYTHEAVITHEDLTESTDNTAQVIDILDLDAGQTIEKIAWELETPFEDASDNAYNSTTLTMKAGSTSLISAEQVNRNGTEVLRDRTDTPNTSASAETLTATFGSMTDKALEDIDTGEVHIFFRLENTPGLDASLS